MPAKPRLLPTAKATTEAVVAVGATVTPKTRNPRTGLPAAWVAAATRGVAWLRLRPRKSKRVNLLAKPGAKMTRFRALKCLTALWRVRLLVLPHRLRLPGLLPPPAPHLPVGPRLRPLPVVLRRLLLLVGLLPLPPVAPRLLRRPRRRLVVRLRLLLPGVLRPHRPLPGVRLLPRLRPAL